MIVTLALDTHFASGLVGGWTCSNFVCWFSFLPQVMNIPFGLAFCLVVGASLVISYPRNDYTVQEVSIDCSNSHLVRVLGDVGIPFRCIQSSNELLGETTLFEGSVNRKKLPEKWFGQPTRRLKIVCPEGTTYHKDSHACLPSKPQEIEVMSLVSNNESLVNKKETETVKEPICGPEETYNPVTQLCNGPVECEKGTTYNPMTHSCHPTSKCKPGTIYNPSVDLCLFHASPGIETQSDQAQGDSSPATEYPLRLTMSPLRKHKIGTPKCKDGLFYLSEIDLCVLY